MAYYFIAESNLHYLSKHKISSPLLWLTRGVFFGSIIYGAVSSGGTAWTLGDIGVGIMAWLNLIAIILLRKPAFLAFTDYKKQKAEGKDPVFNPKELGIKNTSEWDV